MIRRKKPAEKPAEKPAKKPPVPRLSKAMAEVELVRNAFEKSKIEIGIEYTADGEIAFLYEPGVILVRDEYLERVRGIIGRTDNDDGLINGVTRMPLPRGRSTLRVLAQLDRELGLGAATPNHLVSIAPGGLCPASEPEEVPQDAQPDPPPCQSDDGAGVFVYVADTGLLADATDHPWMKGVTGDADPARQTIPNPDPRTTIPPYAGHGTFAAGVLRCMAPAARVHVGAEFDHAGAQFESTILKGLDAALELGPDIIMLPGGGSSKDGLPYLTFEKFFEGRVRHFKGIAFVTAAGNEGLRLPFWPAWFPQTVAVGALSASGRGRAGFSNHGGWVDVYAQGEGLVNAYATGVYQCAEPPYEGSLLDFSGMARWSGTSFSTPLVTGLIAARMSRTGENGQEAAQACLQMARNQAIPGVGAVLLPCLDANGPL